MAWTLVDRGTGRVSGSANMSTGTTTTESMIKAWIASDYLRRARLHQTEHGRAKQLSIMIRDSDNEAAEDTFRPAAAPP